MNTRADDETTRAPSAEGDAEVPSSWREHFSAYYDHELDDAQRAAFEIWLAADPEHQREYDDFAASMDLIRGLGGGAQAPRDFVRQVTQDIRRQSRGRFFDDERWVGNFRVPYEAFFAVVLVLFTALYFFGAAARGAYEIEEPQAPSPSGESGGDDVHESPPTAATPGEAAGRVARRVDVTLPSGARLDAVSRMLRQAGFATRPGVVDGTAAIVVSVPRTRLRAFAEALFTASGVDRTADVATWTQSGHASITFRLEAEAAPHSHASGSDAAGAQPR